MHSLNVKLWYNRSIGTVLVNYRHGIWYTFVLLLHLQPWPRTMTKQEVFSACMTSQMTCIQYYVKTKHITPHPFILMIKCICVRGWGLKFVGAVTYWVLVQVKCILQPALPPPPLPSLFLTLCHLSPQQCSWSCKCYKYDALYGIAFQSKPRHDRGSTPRDLVLCCHLLVATEVTVRSKVPFLVTCRQVVLVNVRCWWTFGRQREG